MKTLSLLRHGQTESNAVFPARDASLSALGWRQMQTRTQQLVHWDAVLSSPYTRCAAFARTLAHTQQKEPEIDVRLAEFDFGEWIGQTALQLNGNHHFEQFLQQPFQVEPGNWPQGAESFAQFSQRILQLLNELQQRPEHHFLLITHGGVIRFILLHVLQAPLTNWYRIRVDFASLSRLTLTSDGWIELLEHQGDRPAHE